MAPAGACQKEAALLSDPVLLVDFAFSILFAGTGVDGS
jgi:hypothetical protein